ncbi:uncharacterized protein [Prorops nasuta]|uniref:uncharacterized protein n=1 Tax=Prorops nasuta TaxID=863751 RepID=UPI0034CD2B08
MRHALRSSVRSYYRRFSRSSSSFYQSSRNPPEHIFSDNGTNFVGANNQLKELYALFNSKEHQEITENFATQHRIKWHFIPPGAPHFGGLWKSSVKLFKHHFKRVIGDSLFTFEEINTFAIEVEGILNSRPITYLSVDPNDPRALTPADYMIGKPITMLPETNYMDILINRLSTWKHICKVRQNFWSRWSTEYLNELQKRNKWLKEDSNISNLEQSVVITNPDEDDIVRTVTLKTNNGELKRGVKYICPLPTEPL